MSASNSMDSILYFGICSAIMGFAIFNAVLQIAYKNWVVWGRAFAGSAVYS